MIKSVKNFKVLTYIIALSLSIIFITFFSIISITEKSYFWFEAENAEEIKNNFMIKNDKNASSEKAIFSNSISHVTNSFAKYILNLNQSGHFLIWLRFYGENGCGNSFLFSANNDKRFFVGNDDVIKQWHWIQGPSIELVRGKNELYIWNEEGGTGIDKFVITSDPYFIPSGKGESSDFEINFNNGIPKQLISTFGDDWTISTLKNKKMLTCNCKNGNFEYFTINKEITNEFCCSVNTYVPQSGVSLNLIFNYLDSLNYGIISLENNNLTLFNLKSGRKVNYRLYKNYISNIDLVAQNTFSIILKKDHISLNINGKNIFNDHENKLQKYSKLGIGILNEGQFIKEVSGRTIDPPLITSNFFSGFTGDWVKIKGDWNILREPYYCILPSKTEEAILVNGKEYDKNYCFSACIKNIENEAGIIFNFQNDLNYYSFICKIDSVKYIKILQVNKIVNGVKKCIKKRIVQEDFKQWNKFYVCINNDTIVCRLNDHNEFVVYDSTFLMGKMGILSYKNSKTYFDDFIVNPNKGYQNADSIGCNFNFNNRINIAEDFSGWSDPESFFTFDQDKIYISKNLFERKVLLTKNHFKGSSNFFIDYGIVNFDVNLILGIKDENSKVCYEWIIKPESIICVNTCNRTKKEVIKNRGTKYSINFENNTFELKVDSVTIHAIKPSMGFESYRYFIGYQGVGKSILSPPYIQYSLKNNN